MTPFWCVRQGSAGRPGRRYLCTNRGTGHRGPSVVRSVGSWTGPVGDQSLFAFFSESITMGVEPLVFLRTALYPGRLHLINRSSGFKTRPRRSEGETGGGEGGESRRWTSGGGGVGGGLRSSFQTRRRGRLGGLPRVGRLWY